MVERVESSVEGVLSSLSPPASKGSLAASTAALEFLSLSVVLDNNKVELFRLAWQEQDFTKQQARPVLGSWVVVSRSLPNSECENPAC